MTPKYYKYTDNKTTTVYYVRDFTIDCYYVAITKRNDEDKLSVFDFEDIEDIFKLNSFFVSISDKDFWNEAEKILGCKKEKRSQEYYELTYGRLNEYFSVRRNHSDDSDILFERDLRNSKYYELKDQAQEKNKEIMGEEKSKKTLLMVLFNEAQNKAYEQYLRDRGIQVLK